MIDVYIFQGTCTVTVTVEDINDNYPSFSQKEYIAYLPEDTPVGTVVELVNVETTIACVRMRACMTKVCGQNLIL